jgi:hypothetical protein
MIYRLEIKQKHIGRNKKINKAGKKHSEFFNHFGIIYIFFL